ncbi:hypothetical protein BD413DRAFT_521402, partial [Trametes elegans]
MGKADALTCSTRIIYARRETRVFNLPGRDNGLEARTDLWLRHPSRAPKESHKGLRPPLLRADHTPRQPPTHPPPPAFGATLPLTWLRTTTALRHNYILHHLAMSMFGVFSFGAATPFDLPTALKDWATTAPDHPVPEFRGKPKRKDDLTADAWLTRVEKGSTARNVPKVHWPAVAKHFMVKKARARVLEVEKVMRALHGAQWDWCWKNFRVAVLNMGCEFFSLPVCRCV